ncbi:unnamed protein product [Choristocarpus tenellus]
MSLENRSKIGKAFAKMTLTCPEQIAAYGRCLQSKVTEVDTGVCEREFFALKRCFHNAVRRGVGSRLAKCANHV